MLKFQKKLTSSFRVLRPQENVTPDARRRQNPGATKIPLPLRAGDKKETWHLFCVTYEDGALKLNQHGQRILFSVT